MFEYATTPNMLFNAQNEIVFFKLRFIWIQIVFGAIW